MRDDAVARATRSTPAVAGRRPRRASTSSASATACSPGPRAIARRSSTRADRRERACSAAAIVRRARMKPAPRLGAIFLTVFLDLLGFGLVLPFLAKEARDTFGVSDVRRDAARVDLLAHAVPLRARSGAASPIASAGGRSSSGRSPGRRCRWPASASALAWGSSVALALRARASSAASRPRTSAPPARTSPTSPSPRSARGAWASSAWRSASASSSGPGIGGALARIPIGGRHGAVPVLRRGGPQRRQPRLGRLRASPSRSRPRRAPQRRAAGSRRSTSTATRDAFAIPGVALAIAVNFLVILSFTNLDQTFTFFCGDLFGIDERGTGLRARLHRRRRRRRAGRPRAAAVEALRRGARSMRAGASRCRRSRSPGSSPPGTGTRLAPLRLRRRSSRSATASRSRASSAFISRRAPAGPPGRHARHQPVVRQPRAHVRPGARRLALRQRRPRAPYAAASIGMLVALALAMGLPRTSEGALTCRPCRAGPRKSASSPASRPVDPDPDRPAAFRFPCRAA